MTQLERRIVEAELLAQILDQLRRDMAPDAAEDVVRRTIEASAIEAGRQFAEIAPDGPNLAHFATIIKRWREGGALDIEDASLDGDRFSFTVTRCGYVSAYAGMGLDGAFAWLVSCSRDGAFAKGYSPRLRLDRSRTIAQGANACRFEFTWETPGDNQTENG